MGEFLPCILFFLACLLCMYFFFTPRELVWIFFRSIYVILILHSRARGGGGAGAGGASAPPLFLKILKSR